MEFLDAVKKLATDNPDVQYSECRSAMQNAVDAELKELKGRDQYARAVLIAYTRICDWLQCGSQYAVTCTWRDMAKFVSSHRTACVWAVCVANMRQQVAEQKELEHETSIGD